LDRDLQLEEKEGEAPVDGRKKGGRDDGSRRGSGEAATALRNPGEGSGSPALEPVKKERRWGVGAEPIWSRRYGGELTNDDVEAAKWELVGKSLHTPFHI
jgi:hypothetical protein